MKIKSITIENFKSIGKIDINNLGDLNIFIGKNNSGKTNILKALKHFFDNYGVMSSFTIDDYNRQLFLKLNDNLKITIELGIEFDNKELDLLFFNQKEEIMLITGMKDAILIFEFDLTKVNNNYIHGINSIRTTGDFKFFRQNGIDNSYFDFDPHIISYSGTPNSRYNVFTNNLNTILKNKFILIPSVRKVSIEPYKGGAKLSHDCSNLNSILHDLVNAKGSKRIIKEIEQTCEQIVSFKDFSISNPIDGSVFTYINEENINLRLDGYGAGTEGILKIVTLMKLYPDHIFGVEEPEVHIHPEVQRALLTFLKEHFKEKGQIFITTHSSIFINKSEFKNIYLIKKANYETAVEEIKEGDGYKILEDIGIKPSDILESDFLVFVDGPSDKNILKQFIEIYDASVNKLNFVILPFGGQNIEHINFEEIAKIKRKFIVILDSDKKQESDTIKKSKADIKNNVEKGGNFCFLDKNVREIENYFSKEAIKKYYKIQKELEFGPFDDLQEVISNLNQKYQLGIGYDKTRDGHKIVKEMKKEEISGEIKKIIEKIKEMGK